MNLRFFIPKGLNWKVLFSHGRIWIFTHSDVQKMNIAREGSYLHCFDLKFSESNNLTISFSSLFELGLGLTTTGFP